MCVTLGCTHFFVLGGEEMDYIVWLNKAVMKIGALRKDTTFTLKDLFSGIEWDELNRGQKLHLGRIFKAEVVNKSIPNIVVIDTPKSTSTTYKKIK